MPIGISSHVYNILIDFQIMADNLNRSKLRRRTNVCFSVMTYHTPLLNLELGAVSLLRQNGNGNGNGDKDAAWK